MPASQPPAGNEKRKRGEMMTASPASKPPTLADIPSLANGILCDLLAPAPPADLEAEILSRHRAGFSFVSFTMATDYEASPAQIYPGLAKMRYNIGRYSDDIMLVDGVDDIRAAKASGKIGVGFHFQGTEPVGRDLANIGAYYQLGVRWMLMAYNFQNNVGTGCIEAQKNDIGLSAFGRDVVAEMNHVGMIVDCSHSGYRTTMDAMAASTQPCIFSHSNPRVLFDHPRNIRDDQIKACAETGGFIGINGVGQFIGEPHQVTVETVVRNIDYVVQLVGPEHVAFGLDYMTPAHCQQLFDFYDGKVSKKIGMPELPWGFLSPTAVPELLEQLIAKGYSEDALRGLMGENFLRVATAVWK
ncbi:dipeptidase [Sphingosinicella rhizophila]|uniref:Dipeptidase n=1 Tax=Sphingosinicella rhizophila TaxID=3050082 RepID=A0ABU3Q5Z3_9SPHN|nr:dipeptidase [Sphingosinicella sp. GR2756]MDT9598820.1 dipeptidase [Sphingosinicella sp. GR2756]